MIYDDPRKEDDEQLTEKQKEWLNERILVMNRYYLKNENETDLLKAGDFKPLVI